MEVENLLIKIAKILQELEIPYLITGGIAVTVWGRPRATFDIDIVIKLKEPKLIPLTESLRSLSEAGYVSEEAARVALEEKGEFNFIHPETGLKIDFWIIKEDDFSKSEFRRSVVKKIKGQEIIFISPEDLILEKLLWFKKSYSTRQLEDIESILKISKIDFDYVKKWAVKQSTINELNKLWGK